MQYGSSAAALLMKRRRISISASAYFAAALAILLLPLNWVLGWLTAVTVHEFGHILALCVLRVTIFEIEIGIAGVKITTFEMKKLQELLCAAAGPICSFSLLLYKEVFPAAAIIGLIQGMFNLLPIYPLDGGRIMNAAYLMIRDGIRNRKFPCKD